MKCGFCGCKFDEKEADTACKGCFMLNSCKLVRCPVCGYEMPPEPKWLKRLMEGRRRDEVDRKG